jgi:hypothetical protein
VRQRTYQIIPKQAPQAISFAIVILNEVKDLVSTSNGLPTQQSYFLRQAQGQQATIGTSRRLLPASGGGGVSRSATFNAWAIVARVLFRSSVVNFTWTRRRKPT